VNGEETAMILHEIVENKKLELAGSKKRVPLSEMISLAEGTTHHRDFASALLDTNHWRKVIPADANFAPIKGRPLKLIAEIKKASPSRGVIRQDFNPAALARIYADNHVAAISVLTESRYFQGSLEYLNDIREALDKDCPPLLRKDFIFDPYQVYESRVFSADSLLLIAAILTPPELEELINIARSLHMEPLVEVHDEAELDAALICKARIIGINNRDLETFKTDIEVTRRLRALIPEDKVVVSESGISTRKDIEMMKELGIDAVLVGEALMASADIPAKIRELQ
jgi:indole-3-glycerol phosphate synthase